MLFDFTSVLGKVLTHLIPSCPTNLIPDLVGRLYLFLSECCHLLVKRNHFMRAKYHSIRQIKFAFCSFIVGDDPVEFVILMSQA